MSQVNALLLIHDFHTKFGLEYLGGPRELTGDMLDLRIKRLVEEGQELLNAKTVHEQADALIDIMYIAIGTLYLVGVANPLFINNTICAGGDFYTEEDSIKALVTLCDSDQVSTSNLSSVLYLCGRICYYLSYPAKDLFMEVHNANMRKERGNPKTSKYGNGFDIIKPEGWVGPDLDTILIANGFDPKKEVSL